MYFSSVLMWINAHSAQILKLTLLTSGIRYKIPWTAIQRQQMVPINLPILPIKKNQMVLHLFEGRSDMQNIQYISISKFNLKYDSTFEIYMFSLTEQWKKMPRRVLQNSLKKLNFWVLSPEKKSFSFTFFQSIKLHSVLLMLFWSFVFI